VTPCCDLVHCTGMRGGGAKWRLGQSTVIQACCCLSSCQSSKRGAKMVGRQVRLAGVAQRPNSNSRPMLDSKPNRASLQLHPHSQSTWSAWHPVLLHTHNSCMAAAMTALPSARRQLLLWTRGVSIRDQLRTCCGNKLALLHPMLVQNCHI